MKSKKKVVILTESQVKSLMDNPLYHSLTEIQRIKMIRYDKRSDLFASEFRIWTAKQVETKKPSQTRGLN